MSKPFAKLKREDLAAARIWEWSLDESDADESFVVPTTFIEVPLVPFGQFIVAATVELKSGATMPGIAEVTVADGQAAVQLNCVFLLDRQLQVPGVETNRLLARFTRTLENFPTAWTLDARIQGEDRPRTAQIKGGDMTEMVRVGLEALLALKNLRK